MAKLVAAQIRVGKLMARENKIRRKRSWETSLRIRGHGNIIYVFSLIKTLIAAAAAIFTVSIIIPGISYDGDLKVFLAATLIFALFQLLVKPILNLVALPLNFVTFGLFSFFISVGLFYAVSAFVSGFTIAGFSFSGIHWGALLIPAFEMPVYGTAILGSFVSSLIFSLFGQNNG